MEIYKDIEVPIYFYGELYAEIDFEYTPEVIQARDNEGDCEKVEIITIWIVQKYVNSKLIKIPSWMHSEELLDEMKEEAIKHVRKELTYNKELRAENKT